MERLNIVDWVPDNTISTGGVAMNEIARASRRLRSGYGRTTTILFSESTMQRAATPSSEQKSIIPPPPEGAGLTRTYTEACADWEASEQLMTYVYVPVAPSMTDVEPLAARIPFH
jgi:hypothetical protein